MINKKPIEEYNKYHHFGKNYHWKWLKTKTQPYYNYIQKIKNDILNLIDKTNSKIILDAGCGDGVLLYLLYENRSNLELYGFDFIESAIKFGKKKLKSKAQLFVFDLRKIDNLNKEYDLVICTEAIDHVLPPKPLASSDDLRLFHIEILNKLIDIANKAVYLTIPAKEEWKCFDQQLFKDGEEPLLEDWLNSLNLRSHWNYLDSDTKNPKGTYIVEIVK